MVNFDDLKNRDTQKNGSFEAVSRFQYLNYYLE
jgi:hypothetical protein